MIDQQLIVDARNKLMRQGRFSRGHATRLLHDMPENWMQQIADGSGYQGITKLVRAYKASSSGGQQSPPPIMKPIPPKSASPFFTEADDEET